MVTVELDHVTIWTPERKLILDEITWQVRPGEHWVVLGPNGAGKTTLLSLVGADRHPSAGAIRLLGERVGHTDMRALRTRIGRVDPAARSLDWLNGRELVLTGLKNTVWPRWEDWGEAEYARADALLDLVGCAEYAERELKTLSHGEQQRIRIARALISSPDLLLLDEPATGLDFPAREALLASLDAMAREHPGLPTIMVSHHLEDLPTSVTHVLLLKSGRILDMGPVREMLTSERVTECFGFPIDVHEFDGRWAARAAAGWTVSQHAEVAIAGG
jgi:iron complex transport system ATP-binding protein